MPEQLDTGTQFLERKLATILSADVAEFSRLMGEDEEQTLKTFRGHKKVFESLVAMHRGRIFNTAGDAILAEFGSAVEAVRCATDIQAALRTRNDQLTPSRQVRFRIGINLGDVMVQGQDLMGDGVNVAARLQTAAQPGGICLSGSVYDQIRNKLSLSFQSLGEKSYKNIQQPVRTFSILETDGSEASTSAKPAGGKSNAVIWMAVGLIVIVLVAGGVYWAYSAKARGEAERAQEMPAAAAVSPPKAVEAPSAVTKADAEKPAAQPVTAPAVNAVPSAPNRSEAAPRENASRPASNPAAKTTEASGAAAPHALPQGGAVAAAATVPASGGAYDGSYSGPICYGATRIEPARCYRAEGIIKGDKITGQWIMGHETKMSMALAGDVSASGDVKIEMEMHRDSSDGERLATIDLTGTIRNGQISTSGTFRRGRSATLNWHKVPDKTP
jgi:class 3 adenylate cyclase